VKAGIQNCLGFVSILSQLERNGRPEISGFTRTGFIQLVACERDVDKLKANVATMPSPTDGIPVILMKADDVKRLAPSFVTGDIEFRGYRHLNPVMPCLATQPMRSSMPRKAKVRS